ncbi:MAG TPA: twin-arginine translocation signal domain-containing protein, partial [Coleofasciculaceae cyanobacterium]
MGCDCCGLSRRDFLQLTGMFSASLGATLAIGGCQPGQSTSQASPTAAASPASGDRPPVKIGYLPITDAAPLLVAHARKLYEA